jgi:hypothetical protein
MSYPLLLTRHILRAGPNVLQRQLTVQVTIGRVVLGGVGRQREIPRLLLQVQVQVVILEMVLVLVGRRPHVT